ncbi:transcription elongation factor GreA [Labilibaculum sp. A4]|uniref:Transcription elongation factor GreA n=1 Tax=Labilibaculum euxinus TaxID=2686357 RepID=A0A425YCX9_9BACT|nr:transcription elongation factor GreA [Labilibaculum euxinus]MBN2596741.1 transcription elongation factor GreA [Marinifilaceae bacterium]MDQ1769931.1 transcription elongation factor GreA [Labilibaculum euxinus]MUP37915.1 transcription elongation factor GreA [Labilibaculum euxinus]MVB07120.1 transcription elongation factor GreA [Labilibaculum euxinus]MWN76486.1 transcription elongation factor GreA [Labilibaculum euxinus]
MSGYSYVTAEGLKKLRAEVEHLETIERPNISKQIGEAIDKGDLSENAEYDAAKEAQGLLEAKISQLRGILANSRVIDETKIDTSKVQMMTKVTIKNQKNGTVMAYTLVSETEADFKKGKLSINTPIAKGLIGKVIGDVVEIQVPNGLIPFEIIDISL